MNEQFFSNRSYPVLGMIEKGKLDFPLTQYFHERDQSHPNFKVISRALDMGFYGLMLKETAGNIRYISKKFSEAIIKAHDQMTDPSVWGNVEQGEGVILAPGHLQYLYKITVNEQGHHESLMLVFHKQTLLSIFFLEKEQVPIYWASDLLVQDVMTLYPEALKEIEEEKKELAVCSMIYGRLIATLNFIKYAEVETKELPPKKKAKEQHCKYFNDSKNKITVLDSRWFTTLVQKHGFGVRGHFRLQACGAGMKERKLIWINEFQKNGYTAPAKKLKEDERQPGPSTPYVPVD